MVNHIYDDYEDFYDNGPGSENFKRSCRTKPLTSFPNLTPEPTKVFTEETYHSKEKGSMIKVTLRIPVRQWNKIKQRVIQQLARVRLGG